MAKNKKGICMADGGITKETPDQLMARMSAKYGAPAAGPVQSAPVQQPAPQPVPKPQAPQQGIAAGIRGMFGNRQQQLDEQERKANGMANGGIVRGKGTPTSDDVPVKIKGEDYNLSDTEAVLPSKTRQALGEMLGAKPGDVAQANKLVEAFIENTNGKPPVSVNEGVNLANGGLLDEEARKIDYQAVTGVQAPAPTPAPVAQPQGGGWSIGKSGLGSNVQVTTGDAARLSAPAVQQGIATMRNQLATPQPAAASGSNYVGNGPTDPDTNGRQAIAAPSNAVQRGIETMRGQFNQNPAPSENALASAAANEHIKSLYPAGTFDKPAALTAPASAGAPKPASGSASPSSARTQEVANANESSLGGRQGAYMIENNLRSFEDKGNGIARTVGANGQRSFTNVGTENVTDATKQIQTNSYDGAANNASMASANAIRQEMIDRQPQGGIGILGDGGIEAANAEKTARWRQDDLIAKAARNPAAGQVALASANGQNAMGVEEMRQQGDAARNAVAMRGQDIALARADGSPEERQLKQAQAQGIMAQTESSKMLADIQKKALAGDAQAAASYRALTGKSGADYKDRYITLPNRKVYNEMGQVVGEENGGIFDAATGKPVQAGGARPAGQAVPAADKREVGKTYQTPKGPMVWRGNGWEAAQ